MVGRELGRLDDPHERPRDVGEATRLRPAELGHERLHVLGRSARPARASDRRRCGTPRSSTCLAPRRGLRTPCIGSPPLAPRRPTRRPRGRGTRRARGTPGTARRSSRGAGSRRSSGRLLVERRSGQVRHDPLGRLARRTDAVGDAHAVVGGAHHEDTRRQALPDPSAPGPGAPARTAASLAAIARPRPVPGAPADPRPRPGAGRTPGSTRRRRPPPRPRLRPRRRSTAPRRACRTPGRATWS